MPAPNLDDRRFQDLVDDAKRLVQQRCPEWTDHNVSDPGVTLIETFAYMTDQLLYRLNRVPDRLYIKFLELIGVRLLPPTPARVPRHVLARRHPAINVIPIQPGTEVSTVRTDLDESISFAVLEELLLIPCAVDRVCTEGTNAGKPPPKKKKSGAAAEAAEEDDYDPDEDPLAWTDRTEQMKLGVQFAAFDSPPVPGDSLYLALTDAVPSNAVALQVSCHIDGVGVDPDNPPLVWEAWTGEGWTVCELERDETGGLNRDGQVVVHVPHDHTVSVLHEQRGGWLRARIAEADEGQPTYSSSPIIHGFGGGDDRRHHRLRARRPDAQRGDRRLRRNSGSGVSHAAVPGTARRRARRSSSPRPRRDGRTGPRSPTSPTAAPATATSSSTPSTARSPSVRRSASPTGATSSTAWVPAAGPSSECARTPSAAAARGNVARHTISVLRTTIPYISTVDNRYPAQGGVEGETLDEAKARGPIVLRTRSRAVTAEDYELLDEAGGARDRPGEVPHRRRGPRRRIGEGPDRSGRRRRPRRRSSSSNCCSTTMSSRRSANELESTRLIGTRVLIEPPMYQGVTVRRQAPRPPPVQHHQGGGGLCRGPVRVPQPDHWRPRG